MPARSRGRGAARRPGFTLIELLVVVAIITLLIAILLPTLNKARAQGRAAKCLANLHVIGQGTVLYTNEHRDVLLPSQLPKVDDCSMSAFLLGREKYRPTAIAMASLAVGVPPFRDPQACGSSVDMFGEDGDRQNYDYDSFLCPEVPDWTDERNGAYGWNYQFLGNARYTDGDPQAGYKNWPVMLAAIRHPARTVAMADCMGTAASFPTVERVPYENNAREHAGFGNEGFNPDPPRVDPVSGEMAGFDDVPQVRTAVDPRHSDRGNVLWLDGHAGASTLAALGYRVEGDGVVSFGMGPNEADNTQWTGSGRDEPWKPEFRP